MESEIGKVYLNELAPGIYKVSGNDAFSFVIVEINRLNPDSEGNEVLCVLAKEKSISMKAIRRILEKYKPNTFIYMFTMIYRIREVRELTSGELPIPLENIREFVNWIGSQNIAKALGPEKAIEIINAIGLQNIAKALGPEKAIEIIDAIGLQNIAKALGPEKAIEIIKELIEILPEEYKKKLIEELSNSK